MSDWSSFDTSISKLGSNNVTVARIEAQEEEKDHVAAEASSRNESLQQERDCIFQHKQSLERYVSPLCKDKRMYLV